MRRKLQRTLVNTHTLAADLWRLYRSSDTDRSGRLISFRPSQALPTCGVCALVMASSCSGCASASCMIHLGGKSLLLTFFNVSQDRV